MNIDLLIVTLLVLASNIIYLSMWRDQNNVNKTQMDINKMNLELINLLQAQILASRKKKGKNAKKVNI